MVHENKLSSSLLLHILARGTHVTHDRTSAQLPDRSVRISGDRTLTDAGSLAQKAFSGERTSHPPNTITAAQATTSRRAQLNSDSCIWSYASPTTTWPVSATRC
eukprot:1768165-Pyramimonas_sp.AAC.1